VAVLDPAIHAFLPVDGVCSEVVGGRAKPAHGTSSDATGFPLPASSARRREAGNDRLSREPWSPTFAEWRDCRALRVIPEGRFARTV